MFFEPSEDSQQTNTEDCPPDARVTTALDELDTYSYLGLFTVESWREFKRHGGTVMDFTEKKRAI
jgi:hypothetical protein